MTSPTNSTSNLPITINVKTIESQTHSVSISVNETVLKLKEHLAEMLEVPCPRQRLISRGRVMVDDKPLTEYSLEDGQTIHLVTRPVDAPTTNRQNDAPHSSTNTSAGPRTENRDVLFSIINVDEHIDPQNIMQALAGNIPMDMEFEATPTVIHIDGDPSTIRSIFGTNNAQAGGNNGDHARARLRALANASINRAVPPGASLPHLATIDAELTRAEAQLRNVQTILAHPVDQLEGVQLESLDVPGVESVSDDVDGDSTDLARIGRILTQLSESSQSMANSLQLLSTQYHQSQLQPSERLNLQQGSIRAARAMYRLASVQNTVVPMLANATFVGAAPGPISYRFQPPRGNGHLDTPGGLSATGSTQANTQRASAIHAIPFPIFAPRNAGSGRAPLGLIPSIVAHARATAQNVLSANANGSGTGNSASTASTSTPSPQSIPSSSATHAGLMNSPLSSGSLGQMVLGPNGSLSYSFQTSPRGMSRVNSGLTPPSVAANPIGTQSDQGTTSRFMVPTDLTSAGILDFWRSLSVQPAQTSDTSEAASTPTSAQAVLANIAASHEANMSSQRLPNNYVDLERAFNNAVSRRRERPEEFLTGVDRATTRQRLSATQSDPQDIENRARLSGRVERIFPTATPTPSSSVSASTARLAGTGSPNSNSRSQPTSRPAIVRSLSNDARRTQAHGSPADSPSAVSSPSPSSPSNQPSPNNTNNSNNTQSATPSYNLGRIGVFISAMLRMVDQPREDGSPRTLADVVCNDPNAPSTILQALVKDIAESVTVREARLMIEGFPAPMRNIHPILNSFIRERALNGQQLTESNLDSVAVMFAHGIMNAVHVEETLDTLSPPPSIQISPVDIRRISVDVLREHFRRLIYHVVSASAGSESFYSTFARDLVLWIRDVVGSWRVAFYGLFQERDQAEAQRIATHVVGSAIHDNGRRWVELSNRATNTLVNVLCANIVPRRRGEEQAGGLVGGAWPLMATAPRQNASRARTCMAPSLLGSTAPPAPLAANSPFETEAFSENLTRRISQMMGPLGTNGLESIAPSTIRDAIRNTIRAELASMHTNPSTLTSNETSTTASADTSARLNDTNNTTTNTSKSNSRRTRVEEVEDEEI